MYITAIVQQCNQSHYREVPRWMIFMEQELRFGLDLERLALLKKKHIWADYEQLLRPVFSSFRGQLKKNKNIVVSTLKSCIKLS